MIETKIHSIYLHSTQKKKKIKSKDFPNSGKKAINTFFLQVDKKNCFQLE
jgi:hypothetical protein